MIKTNSREEWIDIAKGFGIVAVVMGHSGNAIAHHFLYWFHMPLFFLLSGYLFKPLSVWSEFRPLAIKRAKQLLIPYISFLVLITFVVYTTQFIQGNLALHTKDILRLVYGGRLLMGAYGVFWFITCMYVTQLMFAVILLLFKSKKLHLLSIGAMYLLAHLEAWLFPSVSVPWNIDVSLFALTYFAIGFYFRPLLNFIRQKTAVSMTVIFLSACAVYGNAIGLFSYDLDLKIHSYSHILLDLAIPSLLTSAVCVVATWCSKLPIKTLLASLGVSSLSIMYLHIPINMVLQGVFGEYGVSVFTLIGTAFSYVIAKILLERFTLTRFLFLGIQNRPIQSKAPRAVIG